MDKKLSNNVKQLRLKNNLMTQEELALKVGCTRQTIIAIESNKYSPSLVLAFKISEALNTSINEVFTFE